MNEKEIDRLLKRSEKIYEELKKTLTKEELNLVNELSNIEYDLTMEEGK